jgi:hypothetical protein
MMLAAVSKFEEALDAEEQRELAHAVEVDSLSKQLQEKEEEIQVLKNTAAGHREILFTFEYKLRQEQHKVMEQTVLIDEHADNVANLKETAKAEKEELRMEFLTSLKATMETREKAIRKELDPYCRIASDVLNSKRESYKPDFLRDEHILDLGNNALQGGT